MIVEADDQRALIAAAVIALFAEAIIVLGIGWQEHWIAHTKTAADDASRFIEAQVFQMPDHAQLVEEKKPLAKRVVQEKTLSQVANQGRKATPAENAEPEENQTQSGPKFAPTHGPIVLSSVAPKIPPYLRDKELRTNVVIDFFVSSLGVSTPRLVGSSGNEELDAVAIDAAKKWQFRPAEQEHKPIDSKVRLRIVFEVQ